MFHHSGHSPPGRRHLLTAAEAEVLKTGTPAERRALLEHNLGIDPTRVRFFGNELVNVTAAGVLRSNPAYGAASRGWSGTAEIGDLFNADAVVKDLAEAMDFFESGRHFDTLPPPPVPAAAAVAK